MYNYVFLSTITTKNDNGRQLHGISKTTQQRQSKREGAERSGQGRLRTQHSTGINILHKLYYTLIECVCVNMWMYRWDDTVIKTFWLLEVIKSKGENLFSPQRSFLTL